MEQVPFQHWLPTILFSALRMDICHLAQKEICKKNIRLWLPKTMLTASKCFYGFWGHSSSCLPIVPANMIYYGICRSSGVHDIAHSVVVVAHFDRKKTLVFIAGVKWIFIIILWVHTYDLWLLIWIGDFCVLKQQQQQAIDLGLAIIKKACE